MDASTYDRIMRQAIQSEIEAQKFYADVAAKMKDGHLQEMFAGFVEEEKRHERILEGFRTRGAGHLHFKDAPDFKVAETVDTPSPSVEMKPAEALALAMKNEETAMKHYSELAAACSDMAQAAVFEELAAMERDHKHQLETAFVDVGYPEVW
ncbi:MAG: ferritin family protein [Desulfosarcinaceae bacterium]|jgi:rubrerythrin